MSDAGWQPARRRPSIPLTLLTGALGAGKTSLLNRLVRQEAFADTAVILNEFGEVALDRAATAEAGDGIIELGAGCVCCTIRGELVEALERLLRGLDNRRIARISRVVVETAGSADAGPIFALLTRHPYLPLRLHLDGIVAVVDPGGGLAALETEVGAARRIAVADRIVASKTDAHGTPAGDVVASLRRFNPGALILDAAEEGATAEALTHVGPFGAPADGATIRRWLAADAADQHGRRSDSAAADRGETRIATFAILRDRAIARPALDAFLDRIAFEHGSDLIRIKGIVAVAEAPERPAIIHGVDGIFAPPAFLPGWPEADRRSQLVATVSGLDPRAIATLFDAFTGEASIDTPDRQAITDNPLAIAGFRAR